MNVLFITWDGPRASYLESIFLPIFIGLKGAGISVCVLQFSWGTKDHVAKQRLSCERLGIQYRHVNIWRGAGGLGPLATALWGALHVRRAVRDWRIDVLMPRSIMPALMTLLVRRRLNRPVVFDADGLAADERVDFTGLSPSGPTYRILRDVEAEMVRVSGAVLVRSRDAREILLNRAGPACAANKIFVTVNGSDQVRMRPLSAIANASMRAELGFGAEDAVICYCGSYGPKYNFPEMINIFDRMRARQPRTKWLIICTDLQGVESELESRGLRDSPNIARVSVEAKDVHRFLSMADLGMAIIVSSFSMRAAMPTKVAEYLSCGLAVTGTTGVGDVATVYGQDFGFALDGADSAASLVDWFFDRVIPRRESVRNAAVAFARSEFSLDRTVRDYGAAIAHAVHTGD